MSRSLQCDILNDAEISAKVRQDDNYAQALYASLCNMRWDHWENAEAHGCTWRFAGEEVARIRNKGETYLDFYCSGNEGTVRDDVRADLASLDWSPVPFSTDFRGIIVVWLCKTLPRDDHPTKRE